MQLLISPASPFVRKVRVLIRETGLMERVEEVEVVTTPLSSNPKVATANPLGKIPVLLRDNGPAIYDSRVITRFLNDVAEARLYPTSRIWDVLTLEATADAIMDAAVSITYEKRFRSEAQQSSEWHAAQWSKVERAVSAVNKRWMSHLAGPLDISQIAVACALSYLDLRHDDRRWRKKNEALSEWFDTFTSRESMLATAA